MSRPWPSGVSSQPVPPARRASRASEGWGAAFVKNLARGSQQVREAGLMVGPSWEGDARPVGAASEQFTSGRLPRQPAAPSASAFSLGG